MKQDNTAKKGGVLKTPGKTTDKKDEGQSCVSVGGQAVMEGVMMMGPEKIALAVRRPDGKIELRLKPRKYLSKKYPILGWPIIRGVVNFVTQLYVGMKTLTESAEISTGEAEEPSEFEKKLAKTLHIKADSLVIGLAVALALVMAIGLFFLLPTAIEALFKRFIPSRTVTNLLGGVVRMALFLTYVWLVSRMKEIHRVFMYHGAEHKSIFCFESGKPLTVANAQTFTTYHPRCGTSFIVIVFVISILVFTVLGSDSSNVFARMGSRLLLLPLTAGVSYEILKWLGRAEDTPLVRALKWPGLMVQHITTAEPTDDMVEVALCSLKGALGMPNPVPKAFDPNASAQPDAGTENAAQPAAGASAEGEGA
ncbi:MAG: DUF1385 domain-containing protein [Clostridia bacterium]|nr:DUF1385 domain-containing protein [Clostridia bacterium]